MQTRGKDTAEHAAEAKRSVEPGPCDARATAAGVPQFGRDNATLRAFVIQLAPGCERAEVELSGRVQNLATADGGNFDTTEGLLAILRRVLGRAANRPAAPDNNDETKGGESHEH